jgi:hypothetical protein
VYYEDKIPGQNVLAGTSSPQENGRAMGEWIYKTYTFTPTGVEDKASVVNKFDLEQNYPNPFNPSTKIQFSLKQNGNATLKVYDVVGREVASLINNQFMSAGQHEVQFNANNLTSGVYFYRLNVNGNVLTNKMMLMK